MKDVIVSVARTRLANIAAAVFAESARLAGLARLPRLARVAEVAGAGLDREGGRRRRRVRVAGAAAGDGGRCGVGVERVGGARDARGLVRQLVVEARDAGLAKVRAGRDPVIAPREVEARVAEALLDGCAPRRRRAVGRARRGLDGGRRTDSAVTVSSTGAKNLIQGDDNGHVGRPC